MNRAEVVEVMEHFGRFSPDGLNRPEASRERNTPPSAQMLSLHNITA